MNARFWQEGEPIQMRCDEQGRPQRFRWGAETHAVSEICNRWRVNDSWWKTPAAGWREYIKLTTADGLLCLLAHDEAQNGWVLVRVYD